MRAYKGNSPTNMAYPSWASIIEGFSQRFNGLIRVAEAAADVEPEDFNLREGRGWIWDVFVGHGDKSCLGSWRHVHKLNYHGAEIGGGEVVTNLVGSR